MVAAGGKFIMGMAIVDLWFALSMLIILIERRPYSPVHSLVPILL
jgi:hypothetical protein